MDLLGVGRISGFSSHMYPDRSIMVGIYPIGIFIFARYSPTPWIFAFSGFLSMFNMDSLLRDPLRSWGYFWWLNVSGVFREVSKMVWWTCNHFRASWIAWSAYLFGGIFSCRRVSVFLLSRLVMFFLVPYFPVLSGGIWSSRKNWFAAASNILGSLLSALFFCSYMKEKVSMGCIPFFPTLFILYLSLIIFYGEERIKNR